MNGGLTPKWCFRLGRDSGIVAVSDRTRSGVADSIIGAGRLRNDAASSETGGHSRNSVNRAIRVPRSGRRLGLIWLSGADFPTSSRKVLLCAKGTPSPLPLSGRLGLTGVSRTPTSGPLDRTAAASRYPDSEGHAHRALAPNTTKELAGRLRLSGRVASRRSGRLASLAAPFWKDVAAPEFPTRIVRAFLSTMS